MLAVVNGAALGRLVEIPAYLNPTHVPNQKDVLAIDNLSLQKNNLSLLT